MGDIKNADLAVFVKAAKEMVANSAKQAKEIEELEAKLGGAAPLA